MMDNPERKGVALPAFETVANEYGPAVWRLACAYARSAADRDDLCQEIWIAVWRALPHFRGEASLRTWLYRIAHNRALTWRARAERDRARHTAADSEIPDRSPTPEESLDRDERRHQLFAALRRLPPKLAQPVMLHLEGLAHAEIGEILGITENNVGVRMNRARLALARDLAGGYLR